MTESVSTAGPTITSPIVLGGEPPEPTPDPVVIEPAPEPTPEGVPSPEPTPDPVVTKPATPDWAQKRINELTAKRYEAERLTTAEKTARIAAETRSAELLQQLANKDPSPSPAPAAPPAISDAEIERRVTEKAGQIAAANEFNKACNDIVDIGKEEFKDTWDDALKNLSLVGAIGQNVSPEFLENAIELKSPHKVLHYLGSNLEEAEKIIKLSPRKMAVEMARVEAKLNAPPPAPPPVALSNAPAPVIPIAGAAAKAGPVDVTDTTAAMDDWMMARQKQIDERKKRYQRV